MKIYGFYFDIWESNKEERLQITEIEVEEKPKSYISKEHHIRILKSDINVLNGHQMYCLDNNPEKFLDAMYELFQRKINTTKNNLRGLESNLAEISNVRRNARQKFIK